MADNTAAAAGPAPRGEAVRAVADVLCDGAGRVGALSYLVPDGLDVRAGDAVRVPFGTRTVTGLVLGPGNAAKATRAVEEVYGPRVSPAELALARHLAARHFSDLAAVAARLSPRSRRGNPPLDAGPLALADGPDAVTLGYPPAPASLRRRLLVRAPLVPAARLAALEAARIAAGGGQVLVLCPTRELVADVAAEFASGAARLDRVPARDEPSAWKAFVEGSLPVAVGTRAAALWSCAALAGIVVVEEDHPGHLEAAQPHTHARDVAVLRAAALDAQLVLISANPTPAAIGAQVRVLAVGTRAGGWPEMRVVDRSAFPPATRLVPGPVAAALDRAAASGTRPVVVAPNRRAWRRCVRCGAERPCEVCDVAGCRHPAPGPCGRCGETLLRWSGWDVARLAGLLGDRADVVAGHDLAEVGAGGGRLVVLFDVDVLLGAPGLVPQAAAAHLVCAAAAAAGPGGTLLACTSRPDHELLVDLFARRDQLRVARRAWEAARAAGLPPFGRLVAVQTAQASPPSTAGWPGTVWGPVREGEEWKVLVRLDDADLARFGPVVARLRRKGKVRLTVS